MPKKYTSEQFWKLYENLPKELKDALFSGETGNNIYEICKKNGIAEKLEDIVDLVGAVLVGVLLPDNFQKILEEELRIEDEVAKKVTHEINRFIFFPVKNSLAEMHKIEVAPPEQPVGTKPVGMQKTAPSETPAPEEKPRGPDIYRETIE